MVTAAEYVIFTTKTSAAFLSLETGEKGNNDVSLMCGFVWGPCMGLRSVKVESSFLNNGSVYQKVL